MSKSALREFNTAFMQNLVTKKSSSSPKKNSSGVISSRSESDTIISEWYEKNKKGFKIYFRNFNANQLLLLCKYQNNYNHSY